MKLDRVTITGADDSVEVWDLMALSKRFPFVEWGILFSMTQQGRPRYPTGMWLEDLYKEYLALPRLSAHLCGRWVRELVLDGIFTFDAQAIFRIFQRFQLNFHGRYHEGKPGWEKALSEHRAAQYIFQFDGVNDEAARRIVLQPDMNAVPLFDKSGGAGIRPESWPPALPGVYCGYAGGLSPDNVVEELKKIRDAAGDARIWIDAETKVRSDDDVKFDLEKVERFLDLVAPFVQA